MKSIFEGIANIIVKKPGLLSKIFLIVLVACIFGMSMLSMATGNGVYIDLESPRGVILDHYIDDIQKESVILIIESSDVKSPVVINYLDEIEKPLLNLQYVDSVNSVTTFIRPLNNGTIPQSSTEIDSLINEIPVTIRNKLVPSQMMTLALVNLEPGLTYERKNAVLDNIDAFLDSTDKPPGISIEISGNAAFQYQLIQELMQSMGTLIVAALVLMVIVLGILFSYVNYRFLPVLMVFIGLLLTFGFMGLLGIKISMSVTAAFPVLLGLGIDYSIQMHSRLEEEARTHPLPEAIRIAITKTGPAVMYAMLATACGFLAMFISPVPMIKGFGLVSIIGIVMCYLTSLIGIPLGAMLLRYKPKGYGRSKMSNMIDTGLSKSAVWIAKRSVLILLIVIILAFIGIEADMKIPFNTDENTFVPSDMPAKVNMDKVTRVLGSTTSVPILLSGSDVISLDTIKWIKKFSDFEIEKESKITGITSILDYILLYNNGTMPKTQSELETILEKIPESEKEQYIYGNTEMVILISTIDLDTGGKIDLKDQLKGDLAFFKAPPGVRTQLTGTFEMFATLVNDIKEIKDVMTYLGFLLIALFLLGVYRNINAISPIVPIVAVVGWNGMAMYLLGINYNPMTACLGSMTIGVAAEYTILVMERYIEEKEKTSDSLEAIKKSVQKIGSAIMVSGLATFFGFSALLFSTFPIISTFGLTTIIAVAFSLIGAIFVMPAILSLIDKIGHGIEDIKEKGVHSSLP